MSNSRALGYPNASPDNSIARGSASALPGTGLMLKYTNQPADAASAVGYADITIGSVNAPRAVGSITIGSANAPGAVVLFDESAFVLVSMSSSTACTATGALTSPSYAFVTSSDQYTKILSAQCDRVSNFIFGQLEQVDRSDDDQNEFIADGIANVIGLVGEPAAYTAFLEASLLRSDPTVLEPLLLAIATARHKETEADRVKVLQQYAGDTNYRVRRAAVRALGRMGTEAAKNALREIVTRNQGAETSRLAAALLQ